MIIPIRKDNIYSAYLSIINVMLSSNKQLTTQEIEILGKFMYIDNMYKHLPKEQRDMILFNKLTKEKIRLNITNGTISTNSFENVLVRLRKKGMMSARTLKIPVPKLVDGDKLNINITFQIENNETNKD